MLMKVNWCREERRYADRVTQIKSVTYPCFQELTPLLLYGGLQNAQTRNEREQCEKARDNIDSGRKGAATNLKKRKFVCV
jgi:hypothetical protein